MATFPVLYKRTSNGQIQQWQIFVNENTFTTTEGIVDGKLTESTPTVCTPKNTGRSNETTAEEQALLEAKSKFKKKIEQGYTEKIEYIDSAVKFVKPMLAKKYDEYWDRVVFPALIQPKLDGIRCIATKEGLFSRTGKDIISVPHIHEALIPFFEKHPNAILDGEIYADKLANDFNKIISLAKKTKPTEEDLKESASILNYHVYDYPSISGGFLKRFETLTNHIQSLGIKYVVLVKTYNVFNHDQIKKYYEEFISKGYEGAMIRQNGVQYENKRTTQLLKMKEFQDEEFEIVEIQEGKGNKTGMAGNAIMKLKNGETFSTNIKGSFDFAKKLLEDKDSLVGKMGTIQFFQLTPDGVPRFPYLIEIRDYE